MLYTHNQTRLYGRSYEYREVKTVEKQVFLSEHILL